MSSECLALTRSSSDKCAHLLCNSTENYSQSYHEEEFVQSMFSFPPSSVFMRCRGKFRRRRHFWVAPGPAGTSQSDFLGTFRIVGEYYSSHSSTRAAREQPATCQSTSWCKKKKKRTKAQEKEKADKKVPVKKGDKKSDKLSRGFLTRVIS